MSREAGDLLRRSLPELVKNSPDIGNRNMAARRRCHRRGQHQHTPRRTSERRGIVVLTASIDLKFSQGDFTDRASSFA